MRVLFHPEFPTMEGYTLVALLHELDWQGVLPLDMKSADEGFDIAVHWADRTWMEADPRLDAIAERMPVWNIDCTDISKRHVDAVQRAIFGHGAEVDPRTWHGRCAVKTDENARGRGGVVDCPIDDPDPRMVYQRLIPCTEEGRTVNYRVPVIAGTLPLCYALDRAPIVEYLKTEATACRWSRPTPCSAKTSSTRSSPSATRWVWISASWTCCATTPTAASTSSTPTRPPPAWASPIATAGRPRSVAKPCAGWPRRSRGRWRRAGRFVVANPRPVAEPSPFRD